MHQRTRAGKYRSKFEASLAPTLPGATYESHRFQFPAKPRWYTPDFILPNGIVIEAKGFFSPSDRTKMLAVKDMYPLLDIRFVFQNAANWTTKAKRETYADWAYRNGFPAADKSVPRGWLTEWSERSQQGMHSLRFGVEVKH